MSQLWILLLFLWCYAVTTAKLDTEDLSFSEDKDAPNTIFLNPDEVPLESVTYNDGVHTFNPEDETLQYDSFPPWNYDDVSDPPAGFQRRKRSITPEGSSENKSDSTNHGLNIQKREAYLHAKSTEALCSDGTKNNKPCEINELNEIYNNQDQKDVLQLLSKYQTIVDYKIKNLFQSSENEYQMLQDCFHPTNRINFRKWDGKISYSTNKQLYKKCLELLVQSGENDELLFDGDSLLNVPFKPRNDKRSADEEFSPNFQPFHAWGGKRNGLDGLDPKRVPFGTWGGKRAAFGAWGGKRGAFGAWGGKRGAFGAWGGKRASFGAWGGKRGAFGARGGKRVPEEPFDPIYPDWNHVELKNAMQVPEKRAFLFSQSEPRLLDSLSEELPKDPVYSISPWKIHKDSGLENNYGLDVHSVTNRRSQFNAWGGKRSRDEIKMEEEKRKFGAWAGKRSRVDDEIKMEEEKRKFGAWAGKRSRVDDEIKMEEEKRKFGAWAGKRSRVDDEIKMEEEKRKFGAWAGKRSRVDDEIKMEEEKRKFGAWAGKRSRVDDEIKMEEEKRKFGAWAGKRSRVDENKKTEGTGGKRKFNAWAGKRSKDYEELNEKRKFTSWAGKRSRNNEKKIAEGIGGKLKFGSWAGKRFDGNDITEEIEEKIKVGAWEGKSDDENNIAKESEEKRKFNAWAGKRSSDYENNIAEETDEKRKFGAWGGKRTQLEKLFEPEEENWLSENTKEDHKKTFNVWGGK